MVEIVEEAAAADGMQVLGEHKAGQTSMELIVLIPHVILASPSGIGWDKQVEDLLAVNGSVSMDVDEEIEEITVEDIKLVDKDG
jgi:hypothetical protein